MKVTVEWKDGNVSRQVRTELLHTRGNNSAVKHDGTIYVFQTLKEGAEVVSPVNGKWSKVGRVAGNNVVFLGEGLAYAEQCEQLFKGKRLEEIMVRF